MPPTTISTIGPREANLLPGSEGNLNVNSVWDLTDITYVLRGTIILGGAYYPGPEAPAPLPSATYGAIPSPTVTLTIQAALPGTLLADGETIPNPGASVVVKLLTENTAIRGRLISTPVRLGRGGTVAGGWGRLPRGG